ncbi:M28 family peptidase, partial [Aduncisulcus paluster]
VREKIRKTKQDIKQQLSAIKSARELRKIVRSKEMVCAISLHLSSHGEGITGTDGMYKDTLRPDRTRPWHTWLLDQPQFSSEVATMSGKLGFTFATVNDGREYWGTPFDTVENVNWDNIEKQAEFTEGLIRKISNSEG